MKRFGRWCWKCWVRVLPGWVAPRAALAIFCSIVIVLGFWVTPAFFAGDSGDDPIIATPLSPSPAAGCPAQGRPAYRCEINAIRIKAGLRPLRPNLKLVRAARHHAEDMVRNHYFDHASRNGNQPWDRIRAVGYLKGVSSWNVGENIGYGEGVAGSPQMIVQAWMNSPPHRAIILDPDFREGGAGIAEGTPTGASGVTVVLNVGRRSG